MDSNAYHLTCNEVVVNVAAIESIGTIIAKRYHIYFKSGNDIVVDSYDHQLVKKCRHTLIEKFIGLLGGIKSVEIPSDKQSPFDEQSQFHVYAKHPVIEHLMGKLLHYLKITPSLARTKMQEIQFQGDIFEVDMADGRFRFSRETDGTFMLKVITTQFGMIRGIISQEQFDELVKAFHGE